MRHRKHQVKLARKSQHVRSLLANLVCNLIHHGMIITTLAKAKATRPYAEKMITLGKRGTLHHRRQALAHLRQKESVVKLFKEIAPQHAQRNGGYTRITKLGRRSSDAAEMAILEWVPNATPEPAPEPTEKKTKKKKSEATANM